MATTMDRPQTSPAAPGNDGQHATWIAGRIKTLLSHYYQPANPAELEAAAIDDWIEALWPSSQAAIEHACKRYLQDQPRRRPTPGDIRRRAQAFDDARRPNEPQATPDPRARLSHDELTLLAQTVLPTARRWLDNPDLCKQGAKTLAAWNEPVTVEQAMDLRHRFAVVLPAHEVANPQEYRDQLQALTSRQQPDAAPEPDPIEAIQW